MNLQFDGVECTSDGKVKSLSLTLAQATAVMDPGKPNAMAMQPGLQPPMQNPSLENMGAALADLENLEALVARGLDLNGGIPSSLVNLTKLEYIDLSLNQLVGDLGIFGHMKNLRCVHLNDNSLDGNVPDAFKDLVALEEIDISNNDLHGNVDIFQDMPSLTSLRASGNKLTGVIPSFSNYTNLTLVRQDCIM